MKGLTLQVLPANHTPAVLARVRIRVAAAAIRLAVVIQAQAAQAAQPAPRQATAWEE